MTTLTFDTLAYAKRLREAGFTEPQAEAQAEALAEALRRVLPNSPLKPIWRPCVWTSGATWPN